MRFCLLTIFILFNLKISAQEVYKSDSIRYSLFFYDGCEFKTKRIIDYSLEERVTDSIIVYKPDTLGYCFLPKDSNTYYFLRTTSIYATLSIDKSKKFICDTITITPIYKAPIRSGFYIGPTYYQYYRCGEQCNGFQKANRDNGQLWQKGHFKHGELKSLKTYYSNGTIESIIKERFFNGCDVTYDQSGKLLMRLKYFLFLTHHKVYDMEKNKYIHECSFGKYK